MSFERQKIREELMLAHFKNEAQRTDVIPYKLQFESHPKQITFVDIDNTCYILNNPKCIYTPNHQSARPYKPYSYVFDSPKNSCAPKEKSPSQSSLSLTPCTSNSQHIQSPNSSLAPAKPPRISPQSDKHHKQQQQQQQEPHIENYYHDPVLDQSTYHILGFRNLDFHQTNAQLYKYYSDPVLNELFPEHKQYRYQQQQYYYKLLYPESSEDRFNYFGMPEENQRTGAESTNSSQSSVKTIMPQSNHSPIERTTNETTTTTAPIPQWPISSNSTITMNNIVFNYDSDKPMSIQQPPECRSFLQQQRLNSKAGPKLIWLLFMHRHGDRTPINMAPRDPYNNIKYWPEGFGNLINPGRMRMYKLGQFIRKRYENFLTDNMREIYTRSSDVERCIESANALLAGLYPPKPESRWNPDLLWTPAPVHTVPAPDDYLLNESGRKYLVNYINELLIIQKSDAVKKLYEESAKERELLEKEMGYEFDMFTKFKCTYSTLDIEQRCGLDMPPWYTPQLKEKLYRYSGKAFSLAGSGTENLKKIRSGHLLEDIIERMELSSIDGPRIEQHSDYQLPTNAPGSNNDKKVVHFSTHDSILSVILEALGINGPMPVPPGFGATFFIELYVDLDDNGVPMSEKYLRFFYMDDTESEKPIEKKLPLSCDTNSAGQVTLDNFKNFVHHLLPRGDQMSYDCNSY